MANSATLGSLTTRVRQLADIEGSQHVTDTEIQGWLNVGLSEIYDLLVTHFEDIFETLSTFPTVVNQQDYALPSDFYKLQAVDVVDGGYHYTLTRYMNRERNRYQNNAPWSRMYRGFYKYRIIGNNLRLTPIPQAVQTVNLFYVPTYTPLVLTTDVIAQVIPTGWEEMAVFDAASKCAIKEESYELQQVLLAQKQQIKERIQTTADDRDANEPAHVVDVARRFDTWGAWEEI